MICIEHECGHYHIFVNFMSQNKDICLHLMEILFKLSVCLSTQGMAFIQSFCFTSFHVMINLSAQN